MQVDRVGRRDVPSRIPILYVHHRPQLGGAPASLALLIRELDPRFEAHVYVPGEPAASLFADAGAVVHTGPVAVFAHTWDNPYRGLRWLVAGREAAVLPAHLAGFRRVLRRRRWGIVHLNDSVLLPAGGLAHAFGAKVVWHLRSSLAADGRDVRSRLVVRALDRSGDAAIAIDRDVARRFRTRLPVEIVPNSVAVPPKLDSVDARRAFALPEGKALIAFVGPLRRQKGWPQFVEAAGILVDEGHPVHFVVIGGGIRPPAYFGTIKGRALEQAGLLTNDELDMRHLIHELGLDDHFSFVPFTGETSRVYAAVDVVTFPNQGVGLGRPVLEAAASGRPVVASGSADGGGVLLPDITGLLVESPAPQNLASRLKELVVDPERRGRMGAAAQEHARREFDAATNARRVERIYDRLLNGSTARSAGA